MGVENSQQEGMASEPQSFQQKKIIKDRRRTNIKDDLQLEDKNYPPKPKGGNSKNSIGRKIEKCLNKIKNNPHAQHFYSSSSPSIPSISSIENNFKNGKYKSLYEFQMDIRNMWNFYYQINASNNEAYQETNFMAKLSEDVFKEVENPPEEKPQGHLREINKEIDKIGMDIQQMKANKIQDKTIKKEDKIPESNSGVMTFAQKNELGNKIKQLNKEQLRGIVKLLTDSNNIEGNQKFFEFDIDKLSETKLRMLDKYVRECYKNNQQSQSKNIPSSSTEIENLKKNLNSDKAPAQPKNNPQSIPKPQVPQTTNIQQTQENKPPAPSNSQNQPPQQRPTQPANAIGDSISSSESESDSLDSS